MRYVLFRGLGFKGLGAFGGGCVGLEEQGALFWV